MEEQEQNTPKSHSRAGTERAGRGKIVSSWDAKQAGMGQGFIRTKHTGGKANPTEYQASKNLGTGEGPTKVEIDDMKKRFPGDYKFMKNDLGLSDEEIYKKLN